MSHHKLWFSSEMAILHADSNPCGWNANYPTEFTILQWEDVTSISRKPFPDLQLQSRGRCDTATDYEICFAVECLFNCTSLDTVHNSSRYCGDRSSWPTRMAWVHLQIVLYAGQGSFKCWRRCLMDFSWRLCVRTMEFDNTFVTIWEIFSTNGQLHDYFTSSFAASTFLLNALKIWCLVTFL